MHRHSEHVPADLRQNIAERLRGVCGDWPEERFAELVEEVARVVLKYDYGRDARGGKLAPSDMPPNDVAGV
jgi:hypothetical protein